MGTANSKTPFHTIQYHKIDTSCYSIISSEHESITLEEYMAVRHAKTQAVEKVTDWFERNSKIFKKTPEQLPYLPHLELNFEREYSTWSTVLSRSVSHQKHKTLSSGLTRAPDNDYKFTKHLLRRTQTTLSILQEKYNNYR